MAYTSRLPSVKRFCKTGGKSLLAIILFGDSLEVVEKSAYLEVIVNGDGGTVDEISSYIVSHNGQSGSLL